MIRHMAENTSTMRCEWRIRRQGTINEVRVFLMADAVLAAKAKQKSPDGYYNIEGMLKGALARKGNLLLCGTCTDARGIDQSELMEGAKRSTRDELAAKTSPADKVIVL
jgi:uncharacterized protein involved in oxidation of intracellular sulfur